MAADTAAAASFAERLLDAPPSPGVGNDRYEEDDDDYSEGQESLAWASSSSGSLSDDEEESGDEDDEDVVLLDVSEEGSPVSVAPSRPHRRCRRRRNTNISPSTRRTETQRTRTKTTRTKTRTTRTTRKRAKETYDDDDAVPPPLPPQSRPKQRKRTRRRPERLADWMVPLAQEADWTHQPQSYERHDVTVLHISHLSAEQAEEARAARAEHRRRYGNGTDTGGAGHRSGGAAGGRSGGRMQKIKCPTCRTKVNAPFRVFAAPSEACVQCPVCNSTRNISKDKVTLSCGHSCCEVCYDRLVAL